MKDRQNPSKPLPTYIVIYSNKGDKIGRATQVKGLANARARTKQLEKSYDKVRIGRKK